MPPRTRNTRVEKRTAALGDDALVASRKKRTRNKSRQSLSRELSEDNDKQDISCSETTKTIDAVKVNTTLNTENSDVNLNFNLRTDLPRIGVVRQYEERGHSLPQYLYSGRFQPSGNPSLNKITCHPVVNMLYTMSLYRTASPFQRRVQAIEWHPYHPNVVAVASKLGEIILWNIDQLNQDIMIPGGGVGDQINSMKFLPSDHTKLITTAANGMLQFRDLEGKQSQILLDTQNFVENWYCGSDISPEQNVIVAGDNFGNTEIVTPRGEKGWKHRLHKSKVTHVEFSLKETNMFCTASVDRTVKLWDLRMIKDKKSALYVLEHEKPINSAYFSPTDGCRLLTTDQSDEIRIYSGPSWRLERTIHHPHRHFQHITSIKAAWHPLVDLIIVGRYPDKNSAPSETRSIDIFDADSGLIVHQLNDVSAPGIVSLNKFNHRGDCVVSGMGYNILVWSHGDVVGRHQRLMGDMKSKGLDPDRNNNRRRNQGGRGMSKKKQKHGDTQTKVKTKTKTKTV